MADVFSLGASIPPGMCPVEIADLDTEALDAILDAATALMDLPAEIELFPPSGTGPGLVLPILLARKTLQHIIVLRLARDNGDRQG